MATARQQVLKIVAALMLGIFLVNSQSFAQSSAKKRKAKDSGQQALVVVDGAAIYEKANFDSPVMDYLERSKKVLISKKVYRGAGGLGAFYKIKVRKGVFGYITDVDVQVEGGKKRPSEDERNESEDGMDPTQISSSLENEEPDEEPGGTGIFFTRYLGLGFNQINYAEVIKRATRSDSTQMLALKMSGPGKAMGGMPLDFEFAFTTTAPDFYDRYFSSSKGFLLIGHAMTIIPLTEFSKSMIYYGFGLMGKYSKFDVVIRDNPVTKPIDSQDLAIGLGGHVGYAHAIGGRYCVRVDGKYYFEKEGYFGFGAALQMKF